MKINSWIYLLACVLLHNFVTTPTLGKDLDDSSNQQDKEKRPINSTMDDFMDLMRAFDLNYNVTNIYTLDEKDLSSAKLPQPLWSYHSLPVYKGGTANRYNHSEFNNQGNWNGRYRSYRQNPVDRLVARGATNMLSPLEKYELIIGNNNFSLTAREWAEGKEYIDRIGTIPTWVGACHGTAPASTIHPRPKKAVSVLSSDGKTPVVFYPSDIKSLLALAWANNGGPSAVMGGRCNWLIENEVKSCLDTNPGSFHLALSNLVGIHKKPLIIDTDSGAEVWNRPLVGYKFSYFNPQVRNYTRRVSNAVIDIEKYHDDPYRIHRAPGTKKIVGVHSEVELINSTPPSALSTDSVSNDRSFKLVFIYDLELSQSGEILGGMWHQTNFPDFVWVVSEQYLPLSRSERWIPRLPIMSSNVNQLPALLKELGRDSVEHEQVSFWLIEYLLRLSRS